MTDPALYDDVADVGLLYDAVPAYAARGDVAFYVAEAAAAGGPVLEIGCGTGRVLLPMARAGHTVVGVDGSAGMLTRCAERLAAEPVEARSRVTLHHADARDLGDVARGPFALAVAPFRILQHLATVDEQLAALDGVARRLAPGGRLAFDVFNPSFASLVAADGVEREDTPPQPLGDGRTMRRAFRRAAVRWVDQVTEVELIYDVTAPGGATERRVHAFDMRWYLRAELTHLLARAGFAIESVHGDFAGAPLVDGSPEIVVRARKATA